MERKSTESITRLVLLVAFWSFFTGLLVDTGIDRYHLHNKTSAWIFPAVAAIICGLGVSICMRKLIDRTRER